MSATKPYIISFDCAELVDFSKQVCQSLRDTHSEFFKDKVFNQNHLMFNGNNDNTYFLLNNEKIKILQSMFPFLSGIGYELSYPPGSEGVAHIDGLSTSTMFAYNLIVPVVNPEHTITKYYNSELTTEDCPGLFTQFLPEFKTPDDDNIIFSHTIIKPTLFYNQHLHGVKNYGNTARSVIVWKFLKDVSIDKIIADLINSGQQLEYIYNHKEK
jgi:hypothetical protein